MGLVLLKEDPLTDDSPEALWGSLTNQAASVERFKREMSGGDKRPKGDGSAQVNSNWRRLELKGTDNDPSSPEADQQRTELGANTRFGTTFQIFKQGDLRDIWWSHYLDPNYPITNTGGFEGGWDWQLLMQIKSAQPVQGAGNEVVMAVESKSTFPGNVPKLWIFGPPKTGENYFQYNPLPRNCWVRFHFRVYFHQTNGWWEAEIDNREGNPSDFVPQITSGKQVGATLATNSGDPEEPDGSPATAHLRLGYYRKKKIGKELSEKLGITSTYVGVSNVQVYEVTPAGVIVPGQGHRGLVV